MFIFHIFVKEPSSRVEIDSASDDEGGEQESLVSSVKKPRFVQKTTSDWFKTPLFYKVCFAVFNSMKPVNKGIYI